MSWLFSGGLDPQMQKRIRLLEEQMQGDQERKSRPGSRPRMSPDSHGFLDDLPGMASNDQLLGLEEHSVLAHHALKLKDHDEILGRQPPPRASRRRRQLFRTN